MFDFLTDSRSDDTIAITALTEAALPDWLDTQPASVRKWADLQGFKAKKAQIVSLPGDDGGVGRVLLGLGKEGEALSPWTFVGLPATLPRGNYAFDGVQGAGFATTAALGWALGTYRFERYKLSDSEAPRPHPHLAIPEGCDRAYVEAAARATFLVRDLINTPPNDMGPADLEREAFDLAARLGAEATSVIGEDLIDANFPAIYAVGKGSERAPRLIDLRWGDPSHPKVTLVGKGVCFDTGGYNLKPGSGMALMKKDMGGAAHVLGLAHMIVSLNVPVRLRVLVAAVENSVSGNAFRPSDVIDTHKGLTVEIGNTDAEGRLVLCDLLTFAAEHRPELLIDAATLTGAARVALGPDLPALFTNDAQVAETVEKFGNDVQDSTWRLPLHRKYVSWLDSAVADLNNVAAKPMAGAIVAALFLEQFIPDGLRWAHVDLYAWNDQTRPGRPEGGEIQAARALARASISLLTG